MTTIFEAEVTCSVCGKLSKFRVLGSTNSFGYADLDLRPPEMERSTIGHTVQRCPECGFCSSTIGREKRRSKTTIATPRYRFQLQDDRYPELANTYLCAAMVEEHAGNRMFGAWMALHAAWVCDDLDKDELARSCRAKALELFRIGLWEGQEFGSKATPYVMMMELMRRTGLRQGIERVIDQALESSPNEIERQVILFQTELIRREDEECHTIEEAMEYRGADSSKGD